MADTPTVPEGSTSYHDYSLTKEDGTTPVDSVEALQYKVTDGVSILVDWTSIPLTVTGIVTILPAINTLQSSGIKNRYLALKATHNSGDIITTEVKYKITDLKGVVSI